MGRRVQGVGIGLRRPLFDALLASSRTVDWLELVPENFVTHGGWRSRMLTACAERWPLIAHGVSLSLGGPDALNREYLVGLKRLLDQIDPPFFSEHLCWASSDAHQFYDLLPLPFTEETVHWVAGRVRRVADVIERPIVLENITYYAVMPQSSLSEGEFIRAVLEEGDAGLLLDVNNTYLNAVNHGRDPEAVLSELPLERTRQIHLAGYQVEEDGILLDHHGEPVADAVWDLYRLALQKVGPVPTLLEWDNNIPALDRVLDEADRARAIFEDVCRSACHDNAREPQPLVSSQDRVSVSDVGCRATPAPGS